MHWFYILNFINTYAYCVQNLLNFESSPFDKLFRYLVYYFTRNFRNEYTSAMNEFDFKKYLSKFYDRNNHGGGNLKCLLHLSESFDWH